MAVTKTHMMELCQSRLSEAISWQRTKRPRPSSELLEAYKAGFEQGWAEALETARRHGYQGANYYT